MTGASASLGLLVNRRREIDLLAAAIDAAAAGRGGFYLVSGMRGVGKTRVLDEVAALAEQRNMLVLQSRADGTASRGLAAWASIVQPLIEHPLSATVDSDVRREAARIIPIGHGAAFDEAIATDTAYDRFLRMDALSLFLHSMARTQPLVLLLDDLEKANSPSLLALELLARDIHRARILLVGAYRDDDRLRAGHLGRRLGNLVRYSTAVPLGELDSSGTRALIAARTGKAPSLPLASLLHDATGGNPFFLNEMLTQFAEPERARALVLVPDRVQEAVRAWRNSLPAESQLILETASVVGRVFDAELLALAHDLGTPDTLSALSAAATAGLVQQTITGAFRFRHGLTREAIYSDVGAERRRVLHDAVGSALEIRHASRYDSVLPALAHHFSAGQLELNPVRARTYLRLAGEQSLHLCAYEQAARYFERALALLDPAGDAPDRERAELHLLLASAALRAGEIERGNDAARVAAREARRLRSRVLLAKAGLAMRRSDIAHADAELLGLLEEARAALGTSDPALAARIDAQLARELALGGHWRRAETLSRSALATARGLNDPATLVVALASRCRTLNQPSQEEERLALSAELLDRALQLGDRERAMEARSSRIADFLALGDPAFDGEIRAASRLTESTRQPLHRWWCLLWRGMRANLAGDLRRSKRLAADAFTLGSRVQPRTARIALTIQTIVRVWQHGDAARVQSLVEGFAAEHEMVYPECRAARVWALAQGERRGDASRALATTDVDSEAETQSTAVVAALLADASALLDEPSYAASLYRQLLPYSGRVIVLGPALECLGPADRYLGQLATLRAEWADAERHFTRSLEISRLLAAPPFIARTLLNHAAMLSARGRSDDQPRAQSLLTEALNGAQRCGMAAVAHAAEDLQRRLQ